MKLTDEIKVFYKEVQDCILGFMVLYDKKDEDTPQLENRLNTAKKWAQKGREDGKVVGFKNTPRDGFRILKHVSRHTTSNKLWRILDPSGVTVEISTENMEDIISNNVIDKGMIAGEFVWAKPSHPSSPNYLLSVDSDAYKDLKLSPKKDLSISDIKPGYVVEGTKGVLHTYIGKVHIVIGDVFIESVHAFITKRSLFDKECEELTYGKTKKISRIIESEESTVEDMISKAGSREPSPYEAGGEVIYDTNKYKKKDFVSKVYTFDNYHELSKTAWKRILIIKDGRIDYNNQLEFQGTIKTVKKRSSYEDSNQAITPEQLKELEKGCSVNKAEGILLKPVSKQRSYGSRGNYGSYGNYGYLDNGQTIGQSLANGDYRWVTFEPKEP